MRRVNTWMSLFVIVALMFASLGLRPPAAMAQDKAARFAELLAARDGADRLAGPLSGELAQQMGFSTVSGAAVTAEDFSATAAFGNPSEATNLMPWDMGFIFHRSQGAVQQMVVDSNGTWYYSPFPGGIVASGEVANLNVEPGGANTLDLIVEGDSALFGVNGAFVTSLDLPPGVAADVEVGTGFFNTSAMPGRVMEFTGFEVWSLPSAAAQPGPATPVADVASLETPVPAVPGTVTPEPAPVLVTPEPTAAVSAADIESFDAILAAQEDVAPFAGPFTANLKESQGTIALAWANVNLADFHARATFTVPATMSEIPWNIGFMFRNSSAGTLRLTIDSTGSWWSGVGVNMPVLMGMIEGLNTSPGETNTVDLLVAEQRAEFGVNATLAGTFDLPADATAADVAVGSAFFTNQNLIDRVTLFSDFVVLPFEPDAVGTALESTPTLAAADLARFAELLAAAGTEAPIAGPFAGRLVESMPGTVPRAAAGVSVTDFGASATFTNPTAEGALWNAGLQFRAGDLETNRIVVRSSGQVHAVLPGQSAPAIVGTAANYNASPGGSNEITLFVEGNAVLVGVNGELAAVVTLPSVPVAADVEAGVAFFIEDFVQGRVTDYADFRVWDLP